MPQWIDMDGLANLRDVGGLPTDDGGTIRSGRLMRSDNLQDLTDRDIEAFATLGLTDVIDLRSDYEDDLEGPGPLVGRAGVTIHHHSFFREWEAGVGEDKDTDRPEELPEEALPWVDLEPRVELDHPVASLYVSYVLDRPDSIVAALRAIADAPGAALVHCAAGKDRTGTLVALALRAVGAERDAVVADYAASTERTEGIVAHLMQSPTYADNLRGRPVESHWSHPETMVAFLDHIDHEYGGVVPLLQRIGLTDDDLARLRAKLRS